MVDKVKVGDHLHDQTGNFIIKVAKIKPHPKTGEDFEYSGPYVSDKGKQRRYAKTHYATYSGNFKKVPKPVGIAEDQQMNKTFKDLQEEISISEEYEDVKKQLKRDAAKHKKAGSEHKISFKHQQTGKTITGRYGGLHNMGGRSYAKVHTSGMTHAIPLPHVRHMNEETE